MRSEHLPQTASVAKSTRWATGKPRWLPRRRRFPAQALLRSFLSTSATTFFRESKFSGAATSSSSTVMVKRS